MNTRLHLFSNTIRNDSRPASHTEGTFAFFDRSAWPTCAAIRRELERWFAHYPGEKQKVLKRRLTTDDFSAAFFELFLHELFRRSNYSLEVEPEIQSGGRPDLRVSVGATQFYVEAAVVGGVSSDEKGKTSVQNVIYDAINQIDSPDYFLHVVECNLKGSDPPSSSAICEFLTKKIEGANHSKMLGVEWELLPKWRYVDDKIEIVVRPMPKQQARGIKGLRTIGVYPTESKWGGAQQAIRNRLSEKAKLYKKLDGPFVIAINTLAWDNDRGDMVAALFGSEQIIVDVETQRSRPSRKANGLFFGPSGPRYTRVSAVLSTTVQPQSIAVSNVELFVNPWAAQPLTISDFPATITRVVEGKLGAKPGPPLKDVFGLAPNWPG